MAGSLGCRLAHASARVTTAVSLPVIFSAPTTSARRASPARTTLTACRSAALPDAHAASTAYAATPSKPRRDATMAAAKFSAAKDCCQAGSDEQCIDFVGSDAGARKRSLSRLRGQVNDCPTFGLAEVGHAVAGDRLDAVIRVGFHDVLSRQACSRVQPRNRASVFASTASRVTPSCNSTRTIPCWSKSKTAMIGDEAVNDPLTCER